MLEKKMKFEKKKVDRLDQPGQVKIVYTCEKFTMTADSMGVSFSGESPALTNQDELQNFALFVSEAWKDHAKLKKAVTSAILN